MTFPAPGSLRSPDAAKWYFESVRAIAGTLGRDREPLEMLEKAWAAKARVRLAAALSLVDIELADQFLRTMALPSIDTLLAQAGAPNMTERGWQPKEEGGFLPGWQVKTPDGSRRIDQVAVGELVISAPADGSAPPQPKRVTNVHRREGRTARYVAGGIVGEGVGRGATVMAADATLLWVEDRGWTRVDALENGMHVRLHAGASEIFRNYPIYRTTRPGVAWIQQEPRFDDSFGSLYDVATHETIETGKVEYLEREVYDGGERYLRTTVFDLEVEDFGTYYVNNYWARSA